MLNQSFAAVANALFNRYGKVVLSLALLVPCAPAAASAQAPELQRQSDKPLNSVAFKQARTKPVIITLMKQLDLDVVFDEAVKDDKLDLELKDVPLEKAIRVAFLLKDLRAVTLEEKKIVVFLDTAQQREKYGHLKPWPAAADENK